MMGHLLREITEGQWSDEDIAAEFGKGMYVIRANGKSRKVSLGY